jgi:hypothetical protein
VYLLKRMNVFKSDNWSFLDGGGASVVAEALPF